MNKMRIRAFVLAFLLICCVALLAAGKYMDGQRAPESTAAEPDWTPFVEMSMNETEVSLVGGVIEEWTKWEVSAMDLAEQYRTLVNPYAARPVTINWGIFHIPDGTFIRKQRLEVSTDESFQNARSYELRAGERSVELRGLLVDTQYFFRITVEMESSQGCALEGSFTTKWSPRIMEVENLRNVRDVGGWKTLDGKAVKQGLLYRGSELDGVTDSRFQVTEFGVETMQEELKIKTELDLRARDLEGVQDTLGQNVEHRVIPTPLYADFFSSHSGDSVKVVFETLAQEENYPIYLHCNYGMDRTGIICYVLEALLGMSPEDCYRDWELSVFVYDDSNQALMDQFVAEFQEIEGQTLQEKAENYLLSIGITQDQIDDIRSILVEQ
jgi:hypothetical protein